MTATVPGSCTGSGTGGSFGIVACAESFRNQIATVNYGNTNYYTCHATDYDGSLYTWTFNNGVLVAACTTDSTPIQACYIAGVNGPGWYQDVTGIYIATGNAAGTNHNASGTHVWGWDTNGYLIKARGQSVCDGTSSCNGVPLEFKTAFNNNQTGNFGPYTLYTTTAGSGANDTTTVGAAGHYLLHYTLQNAAASALQNVKVSLTCTDSAGNARTVVQPSPINTAGVVTTPAYDFATVGEVVSSVIGCYSESSSAIQVTVTLGSPAGSPSYYQTYTLWEQ